MSRLPDTERLTFRRFTTADLENVVRLNGDAEVMRFLDGGPHARAEIEDRVLPELIADQRGERSRQVGGRNKRRDVRGLVLHARGRA